MEAQSPRNPGPKPSTPARAPPRGAIYTPPRRPKLLVTNQLGYARVRPNARAPSPSARLRTDTKAAIVLGPGTIRGTERSWRNNRL